MSSSIRLLLMWIFPFWMLLEIVPTKLPNYLLPIYPALALLCGGAVLAMFQVKAFPAARKFGAALFFIVSLLLLIAVLGGGTAYSDEQSYMAWFILPLTALIFLGTGFIWAGHAQRALTTGLVLTVILTPLTYQFVIPKMDTLFVSRKIEAAIIDSGNSLPRLGGPQIYSPQFTEPSLVYRLGTGILLGDKTDDILKNGLPEGDILLFNTVKTSGKSALQKIKLNACFNNIGTVKGLNYSKGDPVEIAILQAIACEEVEEVTAPQVQPE